MPLMQRSIELICEAKTSPWRLFEPTLVAVVILILLLNGRGLIIYGTGGFSELLGASSVIILLLTTMAWSAANPCRVLTCLGIAWILIPGLSPSVGTSSIRYSSSYLNTVYLLYN